LSTNRVCVLSQPDLMLELYKPTLPSILYQLSFTWFPNFLFRSGPTIPLFSHGPLNFLRNFFPQSAVNTQQNYNVMATPIINLSEICTTYIREWPRHSSSV
jgi:hypothetical protein